MMKFAFSAALVSALTWLSTACAQPAPWDEVYSPDTARAELTALYEGLREAHYDLYAHRPKDEYDARFAADLAAMDAPLTRYELYLRLQTFAAYGNVAHARIDFPMEVYSQYREAGGTAFPIYLRIVEGRAYVGEDYSGVEGVALGDEILAINDVTMDAWLERTARYLSANTSYIAHSQLEFSFPLYLWVEIGEQERFLLDLQSPNGARKRVEVRALSQAQLRAVINETPSDYFELDPTARIARMIRPDVAYLRPGPFYSYETPDQVYENRAFTAFINESFETFLAHDAKALVLDLRNNPGGDASFSDVIVSWIGDRPFRFASKFLVRSSDQAAASNQARLDGDPEGENVISRRYGEAYARVPRGEVFEFDLAQSQPRDGVRFTGAVYVLVNRHSYSNAVTVAAQLQDYGWAQIVGEETADFATTFGAMEQFTLPATGLSVGFPKAHIIRVSGDETGGGVHPDLLIETPILPQSEDVVLDCLLGHIDAL